MIDDLAGLGWLGTTLIRKCFSYVEDASIYQSTNLLALGGAFGCACFELVSASLIINLLAAEKKLLNRMSEYLYIYIYVWIYAMDLMNYTM